MANHPSAEKRHRQSLKRQSRNMAVRSRMRTAVKGLRSLVESGDAEGARAELPKVTAILDKAATKGVLHRNSAARRTARLARAVAKL